MKLRDVERRVGWFLATYYVVLCVYLPLAKVWGAVQVAWGVVLLVLLPLLGVVAYTVFLFVIFIIYTVMDW